MSKSRGSRNRRGRRTSKTTNPDTTVVQAIPEMTALYWQLMLIREQVCRQAYREALGQVHSTLTCEGVTRGHEDKTATLAVFHRLHHWGRNGGQGKFKKGRVKRVIRQIAGDLEQKFEVAPPRNKPSCFRGVSGLAA